MERFESLTAIACPLGRENVDTDQLIPARFMSRSRAQGYGGFLLHDLRFDEQGASLGSMIDDPKFANARILVARRNFGTGSSREAAVYALVDYGIRCVIAPSFGDIFSSNATKNGLLTAVVAAHDAETLLELLAQADSPEMTVDLPAQSIRIGNYCCAFAIDPVRKLQLINGWDDLDMTQQYKNEISQYFDARVKSQPWVRPQTPV